MQYVYIKEKNVKENTRTLRTTVANKKTFYSFLPLIQVQDLERQTSHQTALWNSGGRKTHALSFCSRQPTDMHRSHAVIINYV